MTLQSCSIGRIEESVCHNLVHTDGKVGILPILELSKDVFEIFLVWRTGIRKNSLKTICLHNQKQYIDYIIEPLLL